jgi:hypothetical protein
MGLGNQVSDLRGRTRGSSDFEWPLLTCNVETDVMSSPPESRFREIDSWDSNSYEDIYSSADFVGWSRPRSG